MISEQRQIIKKYLDIVLRYKSILILCFIVGTAFGLWQYLSKPKIYQSTALLKYQRQTVNPSAMSPDDMKTRTANVVETVSQQIMSRTSLEEIIKQYDLYNGARRSMPMEDVVSIMRLSHIQTELMKGGDVFKVSYRGRDQKKVMKVTNALAAKFIEENLRFRQDQVNQTSSYIRDELSIAKKSLDEKEKKMRDYKLQFYNEMPEQLANNTSRLNTLQVQYQNNQTSSLELERTRLLVQEQISQRENFLNQLKSGAALDSRDTSSLSTELDSRQRVQLKLMNLQSRYKENHPEIKRLKSILKDLQGQEKTDTKEVTTENDTLDPQLLEFKQQVKDVEFSIDRLNKERKGVERQIQKYENWITAAPIREAEWSALTRDYDQFNAHYQGLVTQSLQADSAQSLENQLKGSQFKIVDSAHFPEKPFSPNFMQIMGIAIALTIGAGGGLSLGFELLNTSFKDPQELEAYLDVPVVCAVPTLYTQNELMMRRLKKITVTSSLIIAGLGVAIALLHFWKKGMIII